MGGSTRSVTPSPTSSKSPTYSGVGRAAASRTAGNPGRRSKEGNIATVDILGVTRQISVDLTPQAMLDDYVLVHAGFAIEVVSQEDAQATLDLIDQPPKMSCLPIAAPPRRSRIPKARDSTYCRNDA